jgi:hypothetical protein
MALTHPTPPATAATAATAAMHPAITEKLHFFLSADRIPNIIFHGPSGSGKHSLVQQFLGQIYHDDKELMKAYIMHINCAHGKGIKFVRDELKFFAKTHIGLGHFKTIVLSNADKLTTDAQSALRRCIELFSHSTRFFIIVEDKYKLLKPILSRLCEIFVDAPIIPGSTLRNLYKYHIQQTYTHMAGVESKLRSALKKLVAPLTMTMEASEEASQPTPTVGAPIVGAPNDIMTITTLAHKLYDTGYSGLDLIDYVERLPAALMPTKRKYLLLLCFQKVKREFRNEKLFMTFILYYLVHVRSEADLENMSFM